MSAYRECVRGIWNGAFRPTVGPNADFDALDSFWIVRDVLFSEFVLRRLGVPPLSRPRRPVREPVKHVHVIPECSPVPIKVNRPSLDGNYYWDDPIRQARADGLSLAWVDLFDWDSFGYIDLQFHVVKIERCSEHPHVVGRAALVDVHHVTVHFDEDEWARESRSSQDVGGPH